ncbi:MAG: glycoside hydrolase family 2 TIM barrel-domain containing protein [Sphaerochaetaceae bacterium]
MNIPPNYPRPQLVRTEWTSLDGLWDCTFSKQKNIPEIIDTPIVVPFSPETKLSGVSRALQPDEYLFYKKNFEYTIRTKNQRQILHFGAVDQECLVFLNDKAIGSHLGGYLPFCFDVTNYLKRQNTLIIIVTDKHDLSLLPKGKQRLRNKGIYVSGQSGIWQSVWLEEVPRIYITDIILQPEYEKDCFILSVHTNNGNLFPVTVSYEGKTVTGTSEGPITCPIENVRSWSPENPFLYELSIKCMDDIVSSYVAMRSYSVEGPALTLNGKPYFHHGILYQGYWAESLYTPPNDQAVIDDLSLIKGYGFNTIRLHMKIESPRWYYHCDRLGLLVWQDMPCGGEDPRQPWMSAPLFLPFLKLDDKEKHFLLGSDDRGYRLEFLSELKDMIRHLYNCPCIAMWVLFNEGWGQFDSEQITNQILSLDRTRTIDSTSGWYDQGKSKFKSQHVYFRKYRFHKDSKKRSVILSEFGGYAYKKDSEERIFSYKVYKDQEAYNKGVLKLYLKQIAPAKGQGLAASIYTQFNDVQQEQNGIVSFDRKDIKLRKETALAVRTALFQDS